MNRFVLCGVAIFFAIVGVALVGGEEKANAGLLRHGCGGDCGAVVDCCGKKRVRCHGRERCHGKERCHGGLFSKLKNRCCGEVPTCCGEVAPPPCCTPAPPSCCGEVAPVAPSCGGEVPPPAPAGGEVPPPPAPAGEKAA